MSNTTSDNDDLGLTHEYIIAGIVILLFGWLYWFLNSGNSGGPQDISVSSPSLLSPATVNTESKAPRQGHPLIPAAIATTTATTSGTTTHSSIKSLSDTNLSVDSAVDSAEKKALDVATAVQENSHESPLIEAEAKVVAEAIEQTTAVSETTEVVENKSDQTESAPEAVPVADDIANNLNKGESPAVIEPDTTNNVEVVPTYSLPDGSVVKISANGFEGDLQQLFQNGELNKPLTYDQIYFDTGSAKINAKSNRQIKVTAALMNAFPKINILLRGHTDNRGSATGNFQLSLARANSMGLALGALGIDTERIRVLGMGDAFPVASNNTDEGRKKNRRIEILLQ